MHLFSVWAPTAGQVDLVLPAAGHPDSSRRHPMKNDGDGWWQLEVAEAGPGTDYAFSVDGGPPLPDPRSGWQPAGVHGPSRVFDPGRFDWTDRGWRGRDVLGAVWYELHVGTFTPEGTLDAALARLDHLVRLGVDVVELMPVAAFEGCWGWGYDGVDLYAVHEPYGGPAALQRFVDGCHARGLAVCLDVVYNHLGPSGNYLAAFGPYFTASHQTPWGPAVNLDDEGSVEVRRWVCDNALRWLADFHLDALRLDAVHSLVDTSARHLLAQLSDEVAELAVRLDRPLALVAESDLNQPRMVEPTAQGGLGMTAQWSDDFHHAVHAWLSGERQRYYVDFGSPQVLVRTLTQVFRHAGDFSTFRDRPWGAPVDPSRHRGHQFLGYTQNHDQVGNRTAGDRLAALVQPPALAAAAALVLTSPFTPLLFMGEEWAAGSPWQFFTDFTEPELAAAVRDGRRAEFAVPGGVEVPDPQDPATRGACVLDWTEPERDGHARMLHWYRDLIALRRAEPDLRDDDLRGTRAAAGPDWAAVHRGRFDLLINLGDLDRELPLGAPSDPPGPGGSADPVLVWGGPVSLAPGGGSAHLPAGTVAVLRR